MKLVRESRPLRESADHPTSADWYALPDSEKREYIDYVGDKWVEDMDFAVDEERHAVSELLTSLHIDFVDDNYGEGSPYRCTFEPDMGFWSTTGTIPKVDSLVGPSELLDDWNSHFKKDMRRAIRGSGDRDAAVRRVVDRMAKAFAAIINETIDYYESGDFVGTLLDDDEIGHDNPYANNLAWWLSDRK